MAELTAVIEKRETWYVGYVEEILGVNTQGRTLKEVRENLHEALRLVIEANRELAAKSQRADQVIKEPIQVET